MSFTWRRGGCCFDGGQLVFRQGNEEPIGTYFESTPQVARDNIRAEGDNPDGIRGVVDLVLGRQRSRVAVQSEIASASVALHRQRRGPAAVRFRLGWTQSAQSLYRKATLNWAAIIGRARASGDVRIGDRLVRVRNWIATYEHAWGDITDTDDAWDHWENWWVHQRGVSWFLYGINRSDTYTGAGARDAQWLAMLARLGRDGALRLCRPTIHRKGFAYGYERWQAADALTVQCPGMRARFAWRPFGHEQRGSQAEGGAKVNGRGSGWTVQAWTPL